MPRSDRARRATLAIGLMALVATALSAPATAADGTDPTWPCVQRRVDHLSVAALWPGLPPDDAAALPDGADALIEALALRRVEEDEAARLVADFAAAHPALEPGAYGAIFARVVERLDRQRARVIAGIERYATGQQAAGGALDALRAELAGLEAADDPDFDRMDAIETEIDWRTRIFTDRARSLAYVCETPVLIERRAFAIGRMLAGAEG